MIIQIGIQNLQKQEQNDVTHGLVEKYGIASPEVY